MMNQTLKGLNLKLQTSMTGKKLKMTGISIKFNVRTGQRRVLEGSRNPADYFLLFYTEKLFIHIANFTNRNAQQKRGAEIVPFFHFNIWNTHLDHILDIFTWNYWKYIKLSFDGKILFYLIFLPLKVHTYLDFYL